MNQDRIKWNKKYINGEHPTNTSEIVKKFYSLAPKGRVLDIATGTGRNAIFSANQGFDVDAIDISEVGLSRVSGVHPRLNLICADLDIFDIPKERYSLILNIRYLNRRLFPYIKEGLIPGGVLIFETYLESLNMNESATSCRDYLLRENELLHAFLSLKIIFYQEAKNEEQKDVASLVAVK